MGAPSSCDSRPDPPRPATSNWHLATNLPRDELVVDLDFVHDLDGLAIHGHCTETPFLDRTDRLLIEHRLFGVLDDDDVDHTPVLADGVAHNARIFQVAGAGGVGAVRVVFLDFLEGELLATADLHTAVLREDDPTGHALLLAADHTVGNALRPSRQ